MSRQHDSAKQFSLTRRQFVQTAAAAGAGLALGRAALAQSADAPAGGPKPEELPVAIIGPGSQGRNLVINCLKIPGIRFLALADIWPYHQKYAANILKKYDQPVNVYADYREMLDQEKGLAAVIVATPDWVHAEQTIACLQAGLHVYCEKEMSNTVEGCRRMVQAARQAGKVVQIGHQRRSSPRYAHGFKLITNDRLLGRITHAYGQWNRARRLDLLWPKGHELDDATLKRAGYDTMERFRNWRWYRKYSGGAMADLGSHQVDAFNWFLGTPPRSVMASGGLDYYTDREWYDNVMAIYEYATPAGTVRAFYQVLNTTSYNDYYEAFMGDEGTLVVSEDSRKGFIFRELAAKTREWENEAGRIESMGKQAIELKIGETLDPSGKPIAAAQRLLADSKKPPHQLHLENFFEAVRAGKPERASCPPEVGFETAVTVLKANEAVEAARRLDFQPAEFKA